MEYPRILRQTRRYFFNFFALVAVLFLAASASSAQTAAVPEPTASAWDQELRKYPGLPDEFDQLFKKLRNNVQFPDPRSENRILSLLPPGTVAYVALPNYGDVASQTLTIFRQQLQDRPVLREWWTHSKFTASSGPKFLAALDQFAQLHQYLGEEIVFSAAMDIQEPTFLFVSEVRRPGLKLALQQFAAQISGNPKSPMRVIDQIELATATERPHAEEPIILVRPDFVVVSLDLNTLRAFNAQLDARKPEFPSTPFGRRVADEYTGGVTLLGAANVGKILDKTMSAVKQSAALQQSGFADMQYLIWDHKFNAGGPVSQLELSFASPRHGAASWLAKPTALGSLDFVTPTSLFVTTVVLSDPAQIFDDAQNLASLSHSNIFAAIPTIEQASKLSLKDDLFSLLSGEVTVEIDKLAPPQTVWKVALAVKDASRLEQTLDKLFALAKIQPMAADQAGVTLNTVQFPNQKATTEVTYAFVDGYLLFGSSRDAVAEEVQFHRSGSSLAKSSKFLASPPPGHPVEASALLFENPLAMGALRMQSLMPDLAQSFATNSAEATPLVITVYGENSAIREVSTSATFDAAGVLIVAAIAIPNLLRSRIAANESSAVGSVRTVNTAQITYQATYPDRGFAPNLATFGSDPRGPNFCSADHAAILEENLADGKCAGDAWCTKFGYNFKVTATCKLHLCKEYVVVATPVSSNTGTRNFCSSSDGLIHYQSGDPLATSPTVAECRSWPLLQ
jgi:type II secretory pathway pseudopilin PulG